MTSFSPPPRLSCPPESSESKAGASNKGVRAKTIRMILPTSIFSKRGAFLSRGGAKDSFARKGAHAAYQILNHGLQPWLNSFAAPRLNCRMVFDYLETFLLSFNSALRQTEWQWFNDLQNVCRPVRLKIGRPNIPWTQPRKGPLHRCHRSQGFSDSPAENALGID